MLIYIHETYTTSPRSVNLLCLLDKALRPHHVASKAPHIQVLAGSPLLDWRLCFASRKEFRNHSTSPLRPADKLAFSSTACFSFSASSCTRPKAVNSSPLSPSSSATSLGFSDL